MSTPDTMHALETPTIVEDTALADAASDQPFPTHVNPMPALPRSTTVLKVSTRSRPSAVAGAIAGVLRGHSCVEVQSIGAGAMNQAIKAIAIARAYLRDEQIDLGCVPFFIDVALDGEDRTAIRMIIERHSPS